MEQKRVIMKKLIQSAFLANADDYSFCVAGCQHPEEARREDGRLRVRPVLFSSGSKVGSFSPSQSFQSFPKLLQLSIADN